MNPTVPHLRIVVAACVAAVIGYLGFSIWVEGLARNSGQSTPQHGRAS